MKLTNKSKTTTDQSPQLSRFDDCDKTDQSKPKTEAYILHRTTTLHLTLKMTTAHVVETSVSNNSLFKDYPKPDDD